MKQALKELQQKIYEQQELSLKNQASHYNHPENNLDIDYLDRIQFVEINDTYSIYYYGQGYDEVLHWPERFETSEELFLNKDEEYEYEHTAFAELLMLMLQHPNKIVSLQCNGPDEGANGTKEWDFSRLIQAQVKFPNLKTFKVQLTDVGDHNTSIMGELDGDNAKHVSQLLSLMPNIEHIEIPGVPDQDFLQGNFPKLRYLKVQAAYDHANFIANIAQSKLLQHITLDYTDSLLDDSDNPDVQYYEEFHTKKKADIAKLVASGLPKIEAKKEVDRKIMREQGFSEEEIALDLDNPNREETRRLIEILTRQILEDASEAEIQEDVDVAMQHYQSIGRWDGNGEPHPDYNDYFDADDFEISPTANKRTPFEDYQKLFKALKGNFHFTLRENYLSQEELFALQKLSKDVQFLHVPTTFGYYVSHKMEELQNK